MSQHEPDAHSVVSDRSRRVSARGAVVAVLVCVAALLLVAGGAVRSAGNEEQPGVERDLLLAAGDPAAWVADATPLAQVREDADDLVSSEDDAPPPPPAGGGATDAITADAFDPRTLGEPVPKLGRLERLLVTGDSLSMPLDAELARRYASAGVRTTRDPQVGTGISKSDLLDWTAEARRQAAKRPQAVVVFIGANEGFSMRDPASGKDVDCCTGAWAALYATRARQMMDAYRQAGVARVYWLSLPMPRDPDRQRIARVVNAAVRVAAVSYGAQVRVLDMNARFTPRGYTDAIDVGGREQIVRKPDGIHLNALGSELAAADVAAAIDRDFAR